MPSQPHASAELKRAVLSNKEDLGATVHQESAIQALKEIEILLSLSQAEQIFSIAQSLQTAFSYALVK